MSIKMILYLFFTKHLNVFRIHKETSRLRDEIVISGYEKTCVGCSKVWLSCPTYCTKESSFSSTEDYTLTIDIYLLGRSTSAPSPGSEIQCLVAMHPTHQSGWLTTHWMFSPGIVSQQRRCLFTSEHLHAKLNQDCSKEGGWRLRRTITNLIGYQDHFLPRVFGFSSNHTVGNDQVNELFEQTFPPTASGGFGSPLPPLPIHTSTAYSLCWSYIRSGNLTLRHRTC